MNRIETTIYVEPTPKARPRSRIVPGKAGGRPWVQTYTPKKTEDAEADVRAMIRTQVMELGAFEPGVPIRIEATFYREKPKSSPKRVTMPVTRPDYDNYAKLLTDALEKFVYKDDSQICTALIKKRFGSPPRIELAIEVDEEV